MDLYAYISLQSFVKGFDEHSSSHQLSLPANNLLYAGQEEVYLYGLSLLRKAIGLYEEQKQISSSESKEAIPFFREHRRMLIGPEMDIYKLSFYENEMFEPEWLHTTGEPYLKLTFDYEALAEHCLFENMFLIRCKYDETQTVQTFVGQMEREYDKFFFDEEHSGFTADSHFFSMMCNACLEVREPRFADEKEWRLAVLRSPSDAEYAFANGRLEPFVTLPLPLTSICRIAFPDRENNELSFSALAGFMQRVGLAPERYLEGVLE